MGWIKGRGVLVALALVATVAFVFAGCGGGDDGSDLAHVNEESGSTNGLLLDEREGTPPPPVKIKDLRRAVDEAGCYLLLNMESNLGKPLPPDAPTPEYKRNPPISGPYVEPPHQQADGGYLNLPEPAAVVGALNNGRMALQYAPDLSDEIQLEMKGLYDTMYGGTLFFPNDEMQYAVGASTWSNFIGCVSWDGQKTIDALRAFGKATWGKYGNEPVKSFPAEGPTPADPEEPGERG